jgi:pyruvate dehydrogenase E2 component (dihydrolipoamide acetyltransferase)
VARALRSHPVLNSTLSDGRIELLDEINIGVAVAAEEGLIVPVIKQADSKSLQEIDAELQELTKRARAGDLTLDDVSGGTLTISNLGMFGISNFRAIINPPEAAILAVGSIIQRPVVVDGGIHIRPMMNITVSADHRILDGVAVAGFLQDLQAALEAAG